MNDVVMHNSNKITKTNLQMLDSKVSYTVFCMSVSHLYYILTIFYGLRCFSFTAISAVMLLQVFTDTRRTLNYSLVALSSVSLSARFNSEVIRLQKQAWYDQGSLPGVGLVDVDDIAQPQRRNTGVEQFLL